MHTCSLPLCRTIFPDHAFGDRCLEGKEECHFCHVYLFLDLNLKILRDDSACPGACQVIKWFDLFFIQYLCNPFFVFSCRVKGCFDALDRKYVR